MAKSTQGYTVELDTESTLGTPDGTGFEIRLADNPTIPTTVYQAADVTVRGFTSFADQDAPITFEGILENAVTLPMHIRRRLGSDKEPPLSVVFRGAGCDLTKEADNTAKTAGSHEVYQTELNASPAGTGEGMAYLVYDGTDDAWWPSLSVNESSDVVTWLFDLPNAQADGSALTQMYSLTPGSQEVSTTLAVNFNNRAEYNDDDDFYVTLSGMATGSLGTLEIVPNQVPMMSPTFHVADIAHSESSLSTSGDPDDDSATLVVGGKFYAGIGDTPASIATGGIDRSASEIELIKATIDFGVSTSPIVTTGGVNNVSGYMAQYDPNACRITVEIVAEEDFSTSKFAEWGGDNTEKSIQFVQGLADTAGTTDPTAPLWGFFAPRCHLVDATIDHFGEAFHKTTLVYTPRPSGIYGASYAGNAPWVMAFSAPSTV